MYTYMIYIMGLKEVNEFITVKYLDLGETRPHSDTKQRLMTQSSVTSVPSLVCDRDSKTDRLWRK